MLNHENDRSNAYLQTLFESAKRFRRCDEGSVTVLTLFFFMMLVMVGGLGVDIARQEMKRAEMQSLLDRSVLAAAGAPQDTTDEEAEAIVADYFAKAGMSSYLKSVDSGSAGTGTSLLNSSRVYADVDFNLDTSFLQLAGINTLDVAADAQAEYATPRLEVSLVLDVSGSMGDKMTELKTAAKSFVTTIMAGSEAGNAYVSVVPFAFNVTPGPELYDALTINETHDYSSCLEFADTDYDTTVINPSQSYDQMLYTAVYGTSWDGLESAWRSCYTEDYATILPYETSVTELHTKIDSLVAEGNTSGNIGMKWGAALLDPAFKPVLTTLQTTLGVDNTLVNMPEAYFNGESLKIIVLMADGKNTTSYKFGSSSTYAQDTGSQVYYIEYQPSVQVFQYAYRENAKWWKSSTVRGEEVPAGIVLETAEGDPIPDDWDVSFDESKCSGWSAYFWTCIYAGEASGEILSSHFIRYEGDVYDVANYEYMTVGEFNQFKNDNLVITDVELTWPEAWGLMSPEFYGQVTGDWSAYNEYRSYYNESGSDKDTTMQASCTAARNKGVIIYTIGYGITSGGHAEGELQTCATSLNHYFPVDQFNISSAFGAIASNVQNLRLTQ